MSRLGAYQHPTTYTADVTRQVSAITTAALRPSLRAAALASGPSTSAWRLSRTPIVTADPALATAIAATSCQRRAEVATRTSVPVSRVATAPRDDAR